MNVWPDKSVLGNDEAQWPNKAMPYNLSLVGGWVQDVAVTSPTNGDMLVYDTLAEKWTNTPSNVKSLRIRTDSLVFKTSTTGAVTPDFIMLEALKANVTGTVAWACSVPLYDSATGGAVTTTGDTVYLRKANMGALATLAITAAIAAEAVSDKVMIAALVDGGEALTVLLYNPNHGLNTTTGGTVTYTGSGTTISVYEGSTALTITGCTAAPTGITLSGTAIANIGTTAVTVADHIGIAADNGRVKYTLTVTRLNGKSATVYGTQSLYKAWQGAMGSSAAGFSISASALVFSRNSANVITSPAYIKITSKEANVSGNVTWATSPSVLLYTAATGGLQTGAVPDAPVAYLRLADMGANTEVAVTATHSAGMTDSLTIVTVRAGTHGITTVLGNPAHSLPTNYANTVTYTGSGTTIRVYEGATPRPITACVATGTGITACAPAGISGLGTSTVTVGVHNTITAPTASVAYAVTYTGADGATGLTTTATQTLVKSLQGVTGNPGTRGSVTRYVVGTAWSDAAAAASLPSTPPTIGDTVTISSGTFVMTKYWTSGGVWAAPGTVIDGSLIVTNSITAAKINSNGLDIRDVSGNVRASIDTSGQLQIFDYAGVRKIGLDATGNIELYGDIYCQGQDIYGGDTYLRLGVVPASGGAYDSANVSVYSRSSGGLASVRSGESLDYTRVESWLDVYPENVFLHVAQQSPSVFGTFYVTANLDLAGTLTLPSKTAKYVFAAPAAGGSPVWRQLASSDLSDAPWALASHTHSYQPVDADLTAIAALAGTTGLLKKTAADTWALDTTAYTANTGTVTSFSFTTGNGISGTVSTATTTPALALTLGAVTGTSFNGVTGFDATVPAVLGTAAAGTATTAARRDHVHTLPTYTAADVGALPIAGGTLTGTLTVPGIYVGANTTLFSGGAISCLSAYASADSSGSCGAASRRWTTVYAATGTINTSDAREKTAVRTLAEAELAAAKDLSREIGAFRFLSAVAAKGDAAREHIGMTVQRAIAIMQSHRLDPFGYSFICYDEWPATEAQVNEHGNVTEPAMPAGNRYSFRPDGLLLFIARGLEARLTQLEERL